MYARDLHIEQGSPYGFYFVPSASGKSTAWTLYEEGGGWCYDEDDCAGRATTRLGSSKLFPKSAGCQCMNTASDALDEDCNCIYLPYCDGASFSGYREKPWQGLMHRGIRNLDATIEHALAKLGLDKATDLVLSGSSAGGLATFVHADHVVDKVRAQAPGIAEGAFNAVPFVGYFLDHHNAAGDYNSSYTGRMEYVYNMQNVSGALSPDCLVAYPNTPFMCFMSPHLAPFIRTPWWMVNSKYDSWQLGNDLQLANYSNAEFYDDVLAYGEDFLSAAAPIAGMARSGGFVTSCVCHSCPWDKLVDDQGVAVYERYAAWRSSGYTKQRLYVDTALPNGGKPSAGQLVDWGCETIDLTSSDGATAGAASARAAPRRAAAAATA